MGGQPKMACPIHKKKYLLNSGKFMDDDRCALWNFDTRVDGEGRVSVRLPLQSVRLFPCMDLSHGKF